MERSIDRGPINPVQGRIPGRDEDPFPKVVGRTRPVTAFVAKVVMQVSRAMDTEDGFLGDEDGTGFPAIAPGSRLILTIDPIYEGRVPLVDRDPQAAQAYWEEQEAYREGAEEAY